MNIKSRKTEPDNFEPIEFGLKIETEHELVLLYEAQHIALNIRNKEVIAPFIKEIVKYLP